MTHAVVPTIGKATIGNATNGNATNGTCATICIPRTLNDGRRPVSSGMTTSDITSQIAGP